MRILISGFEAFGGRSINPTALMVESLARRDVEIPQGVELDQILLPVTFDQSFPRLRERIESFRPDVVLAFGQAGGRDAIEMERVAINCLDADIPDNSGESPRNLPVMSGGQVAYFSTLPIYEFVEALRTNEIPARISNSAGTYVCNNLFYQLMAHTAGSKIRCGFIHVPFSPEQVTDSKAPTLPVSTLLQAVSILLAELKKT